MKKILKIASIVLLAAIAFVPIPSSGNGGTAEFLEKALCDAGLTRREANEFIVYWLPLMQDNEYNVISFQGASYTDAAPLDVTPSPDTTLRVFMAWYSSDTAVEIEPQTLTSPERGGFTVVEWGGTEVK